MNTIRDHIYKAPLSELPTFLTPFELSLLFDRIHADYVHLKSIVSPNETLIPLDRVLGFFGIDIQNPTTVI